MFVLDTSALDGSPSARPGAPSRLARAQQAAVQLRSAISDVPAGVGTLTDRALPNLLPIADTGGVRRDRRARRRDRAPAAAGSRPSTRRRSRRSTELATQGYYSRVGAPQAALRADRRRVALVRRRRGRRDAARRRGVSLILVHFWKPGERVYRQTGRPEAAYLPHEESRRELDRLAAAAGGASFGEDELDAAEAACAQRRSGAGTTASQGIRPHTIPLAPVRAPRLACCRCAFLLSAGVSSAALD